MAVPENERVEIPINSSRRVDPTRRDERQAPSLTSIDVVLLNVEQPAQRVTSQTQERGRATDQNDSGYSEVGPIGAKDHESPGDSGRSEADRIQKAPKGAFLDSFSALHAAGVVVVQQEKIRGRTNRRRYELAQRLGTKATQLLSEREQRQRRVEAGTVSTVNK